MEHTSASIRGDEAKVTCPSDDAGGGPATWQVCSTRAMFRRHTEPIVLSEAISTAPIGVIRRRDHRSYRRFIKFVALPRTSKYVGAGRGPAAPKYSLSIVSLAFALGQREVCQWSRADWTSTVPPFRL